jgi:PAS domain S-box-containing protein
LAHVAAVRFDDFSIPHRTQELPLTDPHAEADQGTTGLQTAAGNALERNSAHGSIDERYRFLAESMPHKVFTAASDGAVNYVNPQWIVFTGLSFEEIGGWGWTQCVHPQDLDETVRRWRSSIDTGRPFAFEHRLRRSDGVYRWHLTCVRAVSDINGEARMWVGSGTDIDDHKRAERDQRLLAELSERLIASPTWGDMFHCLARCLVPTVADACVIDDVEADGSVRRCEVVFADPDQQRELGEAARRFAPQPGWHTPQDNVLATGKAVLLANIPEREIGRVAHDEDHARFIRAVGPRSMMVFPLSARGKVLGILTFAMAESNRQYRLSDFRLGRQVAHVAALAVDSARLYDDARRTNRARQDALAIVSHDLKTPLSVILMSVLAMTQSGHDGRSRKQIESIQRAAELMNHLVGELLDSAAIDADKLVLRQRELSVVAFVCDAVETMQRMAANKGLLLVCELPPQVSTVFGDPDRLHRVFANVIGNAIKFTPEGGTIIVRAREDGRAVEFSVADTGVGIAAADLPHVFERFWQGCGTTRQGTGLGLAIAKGIVEAHGGQIWVQTHVGAGSTFFFTVPRTTTE